MLLALTGDIVSVIAIATFCQLFYYALTNVAAARLVKGGKKYPPYLPVMGSVVCIGLLAVVMFVSPWAGWEASMPGRRVRPVYAQQKIDQGRAPLMARPGQLDRFKKR